MRNYFLGFDFAYLDISIAALILCIFLFVFITCVRLSSLYLALTKVKEDAYVLSPCWLGLISGNPSHGWRVLPCMDALAAAGRSVSTSKGVPSHRPRPIF
ncbi:hypothetical protein QWZ13_05160 [Reinekea marina]|uniref:hypothetical protein n=1 Tax=Reinekea marina TaxID=1310421 RepID=UPI0025B5017A|nr:hypothetical protein [Reinekea marina]MDN3648297.1 hypothetical protein [Reinekea marina]